MIGALLMVLAIILSCLWPVIMILFKVFVQIVYDLI